MTDAPPLLLVDDRPENLLALEAALEPLGHRLVRATSGEEALRHLLTEEFAVIILDVQMPGLDGFATAEAIKGRERTRDIPIIFLTAINRDEEHRLRGFSSGGVDYIFKPVEPDLLRAKVRVFLDLHLKTRLLQEQHEQLAIKTAELERSNADLEQFSYIASHDLQEPLRVISGFLDLLQDRLGDDLDETSSDWLARTAAAAARMSELIRSLLAYARAGAPGAIPETVDLDEVLQTASENVGAALDDAGADLRRKPLGTAMGTPGELVQLFQNLIGNAVKYRGDNPLVIDVGADRTPAAVTVSVQDNGRGVPEGELDRVFGMFERLDGDPYPGTGIGLAVCRRLVERLGGRIWMERNAAEGVTVRFTLPTVAT